MRLLIIGTLEGYMSAAGKIALSRGAKVSHVLDIETGLESLRAGKGADLIFLDIRLNVKKLMESLKSERISIPVVTCGINADSESAASSIRHGASEYIPLPPDPDLIASLLESVSQEKEEVIFKDSAMGATLTLAKRVASSNASILITGESGTGKEVLANFIHRHSTRASQPFISVNCAAIPENLLESELFGHEKGAFTGAVARRIGKFEEASGGTLLLDEISEMHPRLQAKLLRAIQEREIDRVGGNKPIKVDIRLIATSNRNLEEEVKLGNFREDLYFRLNVVNLAIPALRERPLDIEPLCHHFIEKYSQVNGVPPRPLSISSLNLLKSHPWPGNVRELENAMHRAVLLAQDDIIDENAIFIPVSSSQKKENSSPLPSKDARIHEDLPIQPSTPLIGRTVSEVEKELILGTLSHCLGNRTQAAHILGISIRTLRNKLKLYTEAHIPISSPETRKVLAQKVYKNE